ncbi:ATP-binding cassette domain-containing protein [Oceaniglobus ichthyenteri]|uniref:thiamine ABC transporter ATP-binding protein n=1 Tax=Oceaniglobus ichthyenteri TaxID=2136177 RepID=UPI000D3A587C|nr:ATP-binding cassette domain-containing protein [Oceaniglobus ichthyenteri]
MLTFDKMQIVQGDFRLSADFAIDPGAHVAIMGPSGAGKSTFLAAVAGFVVPQSGRLLWRGRDLLPLPPGQRPVSMIFQDNNLFPHLSVYENAALGMRPSGRLRGGEPDRVRAALADVGLAGMETRKPATLSGGQQSRAALARMLVQDRPLVLLDEPFAALGPALRVEMIDLVKGLCTAQGATLLMVTHDPGDAARLDGALCVVDGGQVSAPAPAAAILANPPAALRAYLG